MEPRDSEEPPADATARRRREDALRRLATRQDADATPAAAPALGAAHDAPPWFEQRAAGHRRGGARRWRVWVALLVVVALGASAVVAAVSRSQPGPRRPPAIPPVSIVPGADSIDCPVAMSWSPGHAMIAILGYAGSCATRDSTYSAGFTDLTPGLYEGPAIGSGTAGYVAVYSARDRTRLTVFSPDAAILQGILRQVPIAPAFAAWLGDAGMSPEQYLTIHYTHALWSPGAQRLILTYTCYVPDGPPITTTAGTLLPGHVVQGVMVSDIHGQSASVAVHVGGQHAASTVIWDLAKTPARVVGVLPAAAPFALQPAALSYAWGASGALVPHTPLSATTLPAADGAQPVGAPLAGAASFSVWQPGLLATALAATRPGDPDLTGVVAFATGFAALSPDGDYLASSAGLAGLVVAPAGASSPAATPIPAGVLARYDWQTAPRLPLRDAGLARAIALAQGKGYTSPAGALAAYAVVAWRPDGRVIAVSVSATDDAVALFDCQTGQRIATLVPPPLSTASANPQTSLLAWSASGRQLAFYDATSGRLTLWSGASLPA